MTSNSVVEKVRRALHAAILDMERDAGGEGSAFEELTEQQLAEVDALAQAAIDAMDEGWRDIESAPRAGPVMLWPNEFGEVEIAEKRSTDGMWWRGDWDYAIPATHWRPLPPPPEIEA